LKTVDQGLACVRPDGVSETGFRTGARLISKDTSPVNGRAFGGLENVEYGDVERRVSEGIATTGSSL
jgi:hypothetical protein